MAGAGLDYLSVSLSLDSSPDKGSQADAAGGGGVDGLG